MGESSFCVVVSVMSPDSHSIREDQFRMIADSAPFAIIITRLSDGRFVYVNDRFCALMGKTREFFAGRSAQDLYVNLADRQDIVAKLQADGSIIDNDVQLKRSSDQTPFWACFSAHIGELNGEKMIYASLYDVTVRKNAEETLRDYAENLAQSNSELEQFAYIASHDLQEPLRMISSYVQLLEQRYKGKLDKDADDFIHYAVDGANRLQRMINDLLVFSRVHTRGKSLAECAPESALENALENLKLAIEENGAQVTRSALPLIRADATQVTMLFQNLIANAIKFRSKAQPLIHISAKTDGDFHLFCVEDNGIGIEPGQSERVFEIFQKLHSREKYPGTGIGLAICRRIVARHGGRIWVESEPGKGSRFFFTFPKDGAK